MAAKGAEVSKVLLLSSSLRDTRGVLLSRSKYIGNSKMVKICIGPKFDIKSSSSKDTDMITNRTVRLFDGSILMGQIGSCLMHLVVPVGKYILDIRIGIEFSTLIVYIFSLTVRTILRKELYSSVMISY